VGRGDRSRIGLRTSLRLSLKTDTLKIAMAGGWLRQVEAWRGRSTGLPGVPRCNESSRGILVALAEIATIAE